MTENRYNLLDEAWIPIADMGKAGLLRVFGGRECRALGGTAVQKIAVLKLLIAIAQAAATPQDTQEWAAMGPDGLGERCTAYLKLWRNAFLINGMKSSGKKRDNSGSIGRLLGGMCNSIAEYATKKEGIQPSFFAVVSLTLVNPF